MRTLVLLAVAALLVPAPAAGVPSRSSPPVAPSGHVVRYTVPVPVPAVVLVPFRAPATPYGPGHRGVDLATPRDGPVRAAADAVVRFAGNVAGRGVVVLAHADGITTEYEPLNAVVHAGQAVAQGALLGTVRGTHGGCPPGRCVHWAARRGGNYLDPMTLLAPLGAARLLPWSPT